MHACRANRERIILIWLSCLLIAAGWLVSCDQVPADSTRTPTQSTPTQTPVPRKTVTATAPAKPAPSATHEPVSQIKVDPRQLDGLQLVFWHAWSGASAQALQTLVARFNASNDWGIQVQAVSQGNFDDLYASLDQAETSGTAPDLAIAYAYQAMTWAKDGKLADFSPYIQDPTWGLSQAELSNFYPVFWTGSSPAAERWSLPAQRSAEVLFYNRGWAAELGYKQPPATPEEFRQQACAAASANRQDNQTDNDGTGGLLVSTDYAATLGWIFAYGGQVVSPDRTGYQFNISPVQAAFHFLRSLYDDSCAWQPEFPAVESELATRHALFAAGSMLEMPDLAASFSRSNNTDQWTALAFPSPDGQPAITVYGPDFILPAGSPVHQLASWLFVKWLLQPEQQAEFIQTSGSLPLQTDTRSALKAYAQQQPYWADVVELLPGSAFAEPGLASWSTVRWAVSDATTQLFRYYFTIDQVPDLTKLLDQTAAELNSGRQQ